jgi:hypothetical protein
VSAEGGYQLGRPLTTYELLSTESELAASPDHELLDDLSAAIGGDAWVQRDFYRLAALQRLTVGWYVFTQTVKYRNRFFFNQAVAEAAVDDDDTVEPIELLELIGSAASAHGMVGSVEPGTELFRARVHRADEHPSSAAELGSPPRHRAGANRMSPAGISMFYGALEAETAAGEAASAAAAGRDTVTTGRFVAVRALKVINLRAMPPIPSPLVPSRMPGECEADVASALT